MATEFQGLFVKFGADTVEFDNSVRGVNRAMSGLKKDFMAINKQLKFDPDNVDLLNKKLENLQEQSRVGTLKLEQLRQKQADLGKDKINTEQWLKLNQEIQKVESQLSSIDGALNRTNAKISEAKNPNSVLNLNKALGTASDELDLLDKKLKLDPSNVDLSSQKTEALGRYAKIAEQKVEALKREQSQLGQDDLGKKKWMQLENEIVDTQTALHKFSKSAKDTGDSTPNIGKKLDMGNAMEASENLANGLAPVKDGIINIGQSAFTMANDFQSATAKMQGELNLTDEQTKQYGEIARNVFRSGVVPDIQSAVEAITTVKKEFKNLNNTQVENLTKQLSAISQVTGTDIVDNTKLASKLVNTFGVDSTKALDLVAAGYQRGLNKSGDFVDTLSEYSPLMKEAGFTADEFLGTLQSGLEGGVMNTDKVADSIKEFQLTLGDGRFEKVMGSFSQGTQNAFNQWKSGKATVKDVMASVSQDMKKMNPVEQQQTLSTLSTMFEDMGVKGAMSVLNVGNAFKASGKEAENMGKAVDPNGFKEKMNSLKDSLMPIGLQLMEALQKAIPVIENIVKGFTSMSPELKIIIGVIMAVVGALAFIAPIVTAIVTVVGTIGSSFLLPIIGVIAGIIAVISGVIIAVKNWGNITKLLGGLWEGFKKFMAGLGVWFGQLFKNIGKTINKVFQGIVKFIQTAFNNVKKIWNGIPAFFSKIFNAVSKVVQNVFNALKNHAQWSWNNIVKIFNAVTGFFRNVWNGALNIVRGVFNWIVNLGRNAWNGLMGIFRAVGGFFSSIFNGALNAVRGVFSWFGGLARNAWNGIVGVFNGVAGWFRGIFSGVSGAVRGAFDAFGNIAQGAWNAIKGAFNGVVDWFRGIFDGVKGAVDSALGGITGVIDGIKNTIGGIGNAIGGLFKGSVRVRLDALDNVDLSRSVAGSIVTNSASSTATSIYNTFNIQGGDNQSMTALARAIKREFDLGRA